ncbi:MAG: hypothetical protein ACE5NC_04490 [Anaerolineae bacterium]
MVPAKTAADASRRNSRRDKSSLGRLGKGDFAVARLTAKDRRALAARFCPWLVLFPEDRRLPRPFYPEDPYRDRPVGDYHPIPVEFFLDHADLTTSRLERWLGLGAAALLRRGAAASKGASVAQIERLINQTGERGHPREAVLNLTDITSADPESAWRRYFRILDRGGGSSGGRGHRGPDDPVPPTVYARVVQYGDREIVQPYAQLERLAPPARAVRALERVTARVTPTTEFDPVWKSIRPLGVRRPREIRLRPGLAVDGGDIAIQYWFLYLYNDFINAHEGDWESVTLFLNSSGEPLVAAYASHDSGRRREWIDVERRGERWKESGEGATHPVIYVAAGSHASYFAFPGAEVRYPSEVKAKRRFRQYTIGLRLTARDALDRVPDPRSTGASVRLGPEDLNLVYIPQRRGGQWAWLDHPRLFCGSRALSVPGRGGPQGPAWAHSKSEPNWRWHNPWQWAYQTCVPDDLIFDPFVSREVPGPSHEGSGEAGL